MTVIDKILSEWSFRCHDGIVDMNDPNKVSILNELLEQHGLTEEEEYTQADLMKDLASSVNKLDNFNDKKRVLQYVQKLVGKIQGQEEQIIKNIEDKLKAKNIPEDILDLIVLRTEKLDQVSQLNSLINLKTLDKLGTSGNLNIDNNLKWLNNLTATQSSLSLGKGEILLTILLENANLYKKSNYDIQLGNNEIEVKQGNVVENNKIYGAIISSQGRSYGYKTIWSNKVEGGESFKDKYFKDQKTELSTWTPIFNYYKDTTNKNQFLKDLNSAFNSMFDGEIKDEDFKDSQTFYKKIAYLVTGDYLKGKILILMNSNLNYLVLDEDQYKEAILTNNDIKVNNAFIPRIAYGEKPADEETEDTPIKPESSQEYIKVPSESRLGKTYVDKEWLNTQPDNIKRQFDTSKPPLPQNGKEWIPLSSNSDKKLRENLIEELTNYLTELFDPKGHFKQRVSERGNVLDILNLNEIPLKDYNIAEVKEKLKVNISNEIKERATKILEKESIASSFTYEVGIKVLKPVLVVDGKEYSLKLFAKSTKVTKDGDVIEKDNIGTLYFATVYDNNVSTLLLLNKEDDNELYFQIKKHVERKPGKEDKEAKILTPPNYIYRIDLDELMGNKEEQGPKLIDPSTLPYKVRTDYRAGAKFNHTQYGTGTVVNTSNGTGGKGDSRGKLDWIDVKYPKPFVKGGVATDIRRFNDIITLASPLLAK
jgi:hypothetical protein